MLALVKGRPGRLAAQVAVLAVVVAGSAIYSSINKTVSLSVDGKTTKVHGFSRTVNDLLHDQGLTVGARDIVAPAGSSHLRDGETVVVRYARPLTVMVNGVKRTYWTTETSVDQALTALGLRTDGATMSASRSTRIDRAGLVMWMSTPKRITLIEGGKAHSVVTVAPTIAALLTEQHLILSPLDRLSAVPQTALRSGIVIKLVRVVQKRVKTTEQISYSVRTRKTSKLSKGTVKVITKGRRGTRAVLYQLIVADGKVRSRRLVSTRLLSRPVTQVVEVGTKARPASSSKSTSSGASGGGGSADGLNWAALAKCESGGNVNAYNPAGYYGLYQFSLATWHAQGGSGKPTDYGAAEQTKRAEILYSKTGASSWPSCGHYLHS